MSDPVIETAQQAITESGPATHAGWAILGGIVLKVIEAIAKLFGSPKERTDATARAAEIALRAAEQSEERAERADEETASHKTALGTCEEQLRVMREQSTKDRAQQAEDRARIVRLEDRLAEHDTVCGPRIAALEGEQATAKKMLADLMGVTPTHNPTPDEVRAELARKEKT